MSLTRDKRTHTTWACIFQVGGSLTWLALVIWVSLRYLAGTSAFKTMNDSAPRWIAFLVFFFSLAGLVKLVMSSKDAPASKSGKSEESGPTKIAVMVVHGMGVQDQYQILSQFKDGLTTFTKKFNLKALQQQESRKDAYQIVSEDRQLRFDLYEAYWGNLFNGLTKTAGIALFSLGLLVKVVPTLATRTWKKRGYDLAWALSAISLAAVLMLGIYSGFYISARRLEALNKRISGDKQLAVAKPKVVVGLRGIGIDSSLRNDVEAVSTQQKEIFGSDSAKKEYGLIREKVEHVAGRVARYKPDDDPLIDLDGKVSLPPNYEERVKNTLDFINRAWTEKSKIQQIPVDQPFKTLSFVPLRSLIFGALYSAAFAMLAACLARFLFAQINRIIAEFHGVEGQHGKVANLRWLDATWSSIKMGLGALVIVLALDPYLELLLIQLFMTAGLFAALSWFIRWWLENFLGDVQIYATYNRNSKFADARDKATDLVANHLCELLDDYDYVHVVGHSLGSVIALHAIRRVYRSEHSNFGHLRAFYTIGSPLRKFRQLFAPQPYKWPFLEFNIHLDREIFIGDDLVEGDKRIPWFNYWYGSDIFADRLAYLPIRKLARDLRKTRRGEERDIALEEAPATEKDVSGFRIRARNDHYLGFRAGLWTHSDYWEDPKFVDSLLKRVMKSAASGPKSSSQRGIR